MLQVARLAPQLLGESAELVADFLRSHLNADGGFQDRDGKSDIYYSVFGVEGLLALQVDVPYKQIANYLEAAGSDATKLDFVHTSCLARCWAAMPEEYQSKIPADAIAQRVEAFRTPDGGYAGEDEGPHGSVYGCFLALGAYQDIGRGLPNPDAVLACVKNLRGEDGGYANSPDMPMGLTPSTSAAVTLLRQLGQPLDPSLADWLLGRLHPQGGFFATPMAPMPDLLSTATALHALSQFQIDTVPFQEICLDYIDTLWTNRGGFHGTWDDDDLDVEYTYYGLLALGHLSL